MNLNDLVEKAKQKQAEFEQCPNHNKGGQSIY